MKACVFDVDRTLTNSSKKISERTQRALGLLHDRGVTTAMCTGRHFATLKDEAMTYFPSDSLHVVSGGSQVIQKNGNVVWEQLIDVQIVEELISTMDAIHTRIYAQTGDAMYGNAKAVEDWDVQGSLAIRPLEDMPSVGIPIVVVHEIDEEIFQSILARGDVEAKWMKNYNGKYYADITAKGVSKAVGFRKWCDLVGILPSDVAGFGDSENDIEFLQAVGHAVAVENAIEKVRAIAKEVVPSCDEDGVAQWIERTYGEHT